MDSDTPELLLVMLLPLTFKDEDQDHEEEDLPLPEPTNKLGLLHACSHGAGVGGLARSSVGKVVIPGWRFHIAMHVATVAGGSSTGGQRRLGWGCGVA
jgi:hypothetical protein